MVDEIAIVGRPLVDAELDARWHREMRSTWRAVVVRSERRNREGASTQMQSKVGERVFVGLCMHAAAAAPASGNNAVARKMFEYELIVYMLDVGG
jgi:hypothetical protein